MTEQARRLREARENKGYATAKDAAEALGIPVSTYIQHENGIRGISTAQASLYAHSFEVTEEWLLFGKPGDNEESAIVLSVFKKLPDNLKREALIFMRGLLLGYKSSSDHT